MKGYTYNFDLNPAKPGVISLKPTKSTYARAFLPGLVVWAGIMLVATVASKQADRELQTLLDEETNND